MRKLTKAQQEFLTRIEKSRGEIYFRRNLKTEKEQCFIGTKRIHPGVFFFFIGIGYLELETRFEGRVWEYYYQRCCIWKLNDYLSETTVRSDLPIS